MVRIVNYLKRVAEDGKEFFVLELQGGIEMVKSQNTGKFYVTARKATISSTFDEGTCKALVGTDLPGRVEKINCEPYEYIIKDTGEVITLAHRFEYLQEDSASTAVERSQSTVEEFMSSSPTGNAFSTNGALTH